MPGPMGGGRGGGFSGGSRGGGFSSGGGFSGGSRGGGFHGGGMHHGHHHHHHHGPIFFGPRFYGHRHVGGGCLGGAFAIFIIAIVMFLVLFAALFGTVDIENDDNLDIVYDEAAFQKYANQRYYDAFCDTDEYESNILLVFVAFDGYDGYDCIAWGGNDIDSATDNLFGYDFQNIVIGQIPDYYEFSISKNLKFIVEAMTAKVPAHQAHSAEGFDTSFSRLYNDSELTLDRELVDEALKEFTKKSGYPIAIAVVDSAEIYGEMEDNSTSKPRTNEIFIVIFVVLVIVILIIALVSKKNGGNGGGQGSGGNTDKTDPDAGQGKYDPNTGTWK